MKAGCAGAIVSVRSDAVRDSTIWYTTVVVESGTVGTKTVTVSVKDRTGASVTTQNEIEGAGVASISCLAHVALGNVTGETGVTVGDESVEGVAAGTDSSEVVAGVAVGGTAGVAET